MERENSNDSRPPTAYQSSIDSDVSSQAHKDIGSVDSSRSFEEVYRSRMIEVLNLDNTDSSEMIARQLTIGGRQSLREYEQNISKEVFERQMESNQSDLLEILKTYVEQEWKQKIAEKWFQDFLTQQKEESFSLYNDILTIFAEHGSTYIKDNVLLGLTIMFLFEFDNEKIIESDLFNEIQNKLISEGRHGIKHYKKYISSKVLNEQLENNESPLFLALKDYYRAPLKQFFANKEVKISDEKILEEALDSIANHGLHNEKVTHLIPEIKYTKLTELLKQYLINHKISIPDQSSLSSNENSSYELKDGAQASSVSKSLNNKDSENNILSTISSLNNNTGDVQSQERSEQHEVNKTQLSGNSQKNTTDEKNLFEPLVENENNNFDRFKEKLKRLWTIYKIDAEMKFDYVAQELFNKNTNVLAEVELYMLPNDFSKFKQEILEGNQFKQFFKVEEEKFMDKNYTKFKSIIIELFESEKIQLNEIESESILQTLYENKEKNIADLLKNTIIPIKLRCLITRIQSNEELKTIWTKNMSIFNSMKNILVKHMNFTSDNSIVIHELISELHVDSNKGIELIRHKCTTLEQFKKIELDLYNNTEIRTKIFHEKINVIPNISEPIIDLQKNKEEFSVILNCRRIDSDRLRLENLVEAGELNYINQTLKNIATTLINDFYYKHHLFPQFIQECLTPILYLLKRLQNLDDFINILTCEFARKAQGTNDKSINVSLRMILHILFMSSDIFLRRIIMSLASKRNAVPFISIKTQQNDNNNDEQYEFMPAIIHVWNCTRPTILSFGIGSCKGKSTLLNQLFQSTFEQTVDSIYFQQTIDIDFGFCFNPSRSLNIADMHGIMNIKLLEKIQGLFNGFLIHITKEYFDREPNVLFECMKILPKEKFRMIIIRDTSKENSKEDTLKINTELKKINIKIQENLHIHSLIQCSKTTDRDTVYAINHLREEILTNISKEIIGTNNKHNIFGKLQNLLPEDYVNYLKNMDKIIQPLKQYLLGINRNYNQNNFPLYLKFQDLCKLRQQLKKLDFYCTDSEKMFDLNTKLSVLETELDSNTSRSSPIIKGYVFEKFIEILKSTNRLMSLDLLASELKSEFLNIGGGKLADNLAVEHAFLSLEVIWRNTIVCYDHTTTENQKLIEDSYYDFITAGFPFEIIDGDNFHFQQQFLTKILNRLDSKHMLVISIIGPQNSGKSTLLNYMFGTLFDVREGRCTRGIYGSLVKLNKSNGADNNTLKKILGNELENIDYIMLIDTEGLLSVEKGDKEYDRRIVLFCLAISHLVIVNMMGDVNETLKDMLSLCADSLKQIGVNTTNQPIVHFILNQKADPNIENHKQAIQKIIDDLKEKQLAEVIDINDKTFHTLPSAFKKERISFETDSPCFIRTELEFIERTQQLCEKIIQSAKSAYVRSGDAFSNPPEWLRTAINIFDTLQKFPDLTYFKDINERRQDDQIRKKIGELLAKTLSPLYREQMIKDTSTYNEDGIRRDFQAKFNVHQDQFDKVLQRICEQTNASERIRERCQQFLKRQVTEIGNAWCTAAIQVSDKKQMEQLVKDGSIDLRDLIDTIINRGTIMTKENATKEFETMWKGKITSIKDSFNPKTRLQQAINFVYGNYNIFEKQCLPTLADILTNQLEFISRLSKKQNMDDVINDIQFQLDQDIFRLQKEVLEKPRTRSSTTFPYTTTTLQDFKYLNKIILMNLNSASTGKFKYPNHPNEQLSQRSNPKSSIMDPVKNFLGVGSKPDLNAPVSPSGNVMQLRFPFLRNAHQTITSEMGNGPNEKSNILNLSTVFNTIINKIKLLVQPDDSLIQPIEIDLVQKIVGLVNTLINEINQELSIFDLLLSTQAKAAFHSYILILLTRYYYGEQKHHFEQQISTLDKEKASLLHYFISLTVPDAECDREGAIVLAHGVKNAILSNLKVDAGKIIKDIIQSKENINRRDIQKICDGKLVSATNKWLFDYIVSPTDVIVEEFNNRWKEIEKAINQSLLQRKAEWKLILTEFFQQISLINIRLQNEGSSVHYINSIFRAYDGNAENNLKNKQQCMGLLLYEYLSGGTIKTGNSYTISKSVYTLESAGSRLFENLPLSNVELIYLIKRMKDVDNSKCNPLLIPSIKNLHIFLNSIMGVKDTVVNEYDQIPATFAKFGQSQIYNKLLEKARGCTSACPCCHRPCDVDHSLVKSQPGNEDNRHACQTGHQLRAMAGFKFEFTNEASLFQCELMTDKGRIIDRGVKKSWLDFKKGYSGWDFGNSIIPDDLFKIRGRFLTVWSKIGSNLCEKYDMKFVTENTAQGKPKSFHYILLLDASGSMKGKPWKNLLEGVNSLINIRSNSGAEDRITIILFHNDASRVFFNVHMETVKTENLSCTKGTTDFSKAFDLVIETIENVSSQNSIINSCDNSKFIIIFMSDGQATCPDTQLKKLSTMESQIDKFWTVALGNTEMNVLKRINKMMSGEFKELSDSADLVDVYAEIAHHE